eukprot:5743748-Amphidinium_carterae.1
MNGGEALSMQSQLGVQNDATPISPLSSSPSEITEFSSDMLRMEPLSSNTWPLTGTNASRHHKLQHCRRIWKEISQTLQAIAHVIVVRRSELFISAYPCASGSGPGGCQALV